MNSFLNHSQITIQGSKLTSAYGVYLTLIKSKDQTFFYVGQTGDAKHLSARAPFYRIAAHLSYGKSTQNQLYEYLLKHCVFPENANYKSDSRRTNQEHFEKWIKDKTIELHFFKLDQFEFLADQERKHANYDTHHSKRKKTLAVETALIQLLQDSEELTCLNAKRISFKDYKTIGIPIAEDIIEALKLKSIL